VFDIIVCISDNFQTDKKAYYIHSCDQPYPPVNIKGMNTFVPISPVDPETNPDCTPLGLISQSLSNREITYHGESRYLLFLTDNLSSVEVLKHYIVASCQQEMNSSIEEGQSLQPTEPFVLFGSNFPKDSEFAQVCRNISEIRLCMESGRMVILLNLENLYESLYDVLNQYYIKSGGHRYVDLGLRTNRMKCTVHKLFKLILIAEKDKVYNEFPTPLINRLEKHFVNANTVLTDWQVVICNELEVWLESFTEERFTINDAFIGMSPDTKAAVILQATNLYDKMSNDRDSPSDRNEKVLELSKRLLLQMVSPDAILRWNDKKYYKTYFIEQEHSSLAELMKRIKQSSWGNILLQVTTHSSTLTQDELEQLATYIGLYGPDINRIHLESFQTEQDFLNSVELSLAKGREGPHCVIYECESGQLNGNLISCCRYRLVDRVIHDESTTFFVLLVHLPKKYPESNFAAFQAQPWLCYHVDALLPSHDSISFAIIASTNTPSISDFFYHEEDPTSSLTSLKSSECSENLGIYSLLPSKSTYEAANLCKRLYFYVSEAMSHLPELDFEPDRLKKVLELIPKQPSFPLSEKQPSFYSITVRIIKKALKMKEQHHYQQHEWILDEAKNMDALQEGGTFQNALVRKFDKLVVPIFAQILSLVDRHSNLDILLSSDKDEISKLWIDFYTSDQVTHQILSHITKEGSKITVNKTAFHCQFPFIWIISNFIKQKATADPQLLLQELTDSEFHDYFQDLSSDTIKTLSDCYIHDKVYIMETERKPESNDYYEILISCVSSMVSSAVPVINDISSLFDVIVAVENISNENKSCFDLLSVLIAHIPATTSIINKLKDKNIQDVKILLIESLREVMDSPYLNFETPLNDSPAAVRGWLQKLSELYETINRIFQDFSTYIPGDLMSKWRWICMLKLFCEYVLLKNEKHIKKFAKRFKLISEKSKEVQNTSALASVAFLLNSAEGYKELTAQEKTLIAKCCWSFFLDILSSLYMDGRVFKEDTVGNIVSCVFSDKSKKPKDEKLYKFVEQHSAQLNYLQSFVIKLLLQYE
jgi:hypothetical protein